MRTFLLMFGLFALIILLTNVASMVEHGNGLPDVFQKAFPEKFVKTEDQKAMESMTAPFAAQENAANPVELDPEIKYDPLGDEVAVSETLDIPHRHEAAVNAWVSDAVGQAMTFKFADLEAHKQMIAEFMNATALAEFDKFLQTTNSLALMQSRNLQLKTFVTDIPKLAASGAVQGRYRWVYDIPVNMTFLPLANVKYDEMEDDDYVSETVTLRLQLGRVKEGGREGLVIETWEALKKKAQ